MRDRKTGKRPAKRLSNGENRDFQREKRHLAMGQERTAPFEALEKPPALRVEVTGRAHKASGLSPASFRSSVLSAISQGNPAFETDHGTRLIRMILCRGLLPAKPSQKRASTGWYGRRGSFSAPSAKAAHRPYTGQTRQRGLISPKTKLSHYPKHKRRGNRSCCSLFFISVVYTCFNITACKLSIHD